jgi:hypothetical protein
MVEAPTLSVEAQKMIEFAFCQLQRVAIGRKHFRRKLLQQQQQLQQLLFGIAKFCSATQIHFSAPKRRSNPM